MFDSVGLCLMYHPYVCAGDFKKAAHTRENLHCGTDRMKKTVENLKRHNSYTMICTSSYTRLQGAMTFQLQYQYQIYYGWKFWNQYRWVVTLGTVKYQYNLLAVQRRLASSHLLLQNNYFFFAAPKSQHQRLPSANISTTVLEQQRITDAQHVGYFEIFHFW